MLKTHRKVTLLMSNMSKTHRKVTSHAHICLQICIHSTSHMSNTPRKVTLTTSNMSKTLRKMTLLSSNMSKTHSKMTLLDSSISKTPHKVTLLSPNMSKTHHKMKLLTSGDSFWAAPSSGGKRAPRWPLEARFELFWSLVAKGLPDDLWRLILSCSGLWWQKGSQIASGASFGVVSGSGGKRAPWWPLEAHFEVFRPLVAKGLPVASGGFILSGSNLWWQTRSQMASGVSFWAVRVIALYLSVYISLSLYIYMCISSLWLWLPYYHYYYIYIYIHYIYICVAICILIQEVHRQRRPYDQKKSWPKASSTNI